MNIARFNDLVSDATFDRLKMNKACAVAPIFYGVDINDADVPRYANDPILDRINNGGRVLPFPEMRLWLDMNHTDYAAGIENARYYMEEGKNGLQILCAVRGRHPSDKASHTLLYSMRRTSPLDAYWAYCEDGVWQNLPQKDYAEAVVSVANNWMGSAYVYLAQVNSPSNFIAAVRPDKKGKSVQWTTSRTHYVVLHKSHPANNSLVAHGAAVEEDAAYIKRQAHSRRAHFRILRSPVFRHKVGQKVWVKSCWVGPKEWKQAGSIYVIQDHVKNQSIAA